MVEFDSSNSTIQQQELDTLKNQVQEVHHKLQEEKKTKKVGWWDLPYQRVSEVQKKATDIRKRFDALVVLGIGGSSQGFKALAHALASKESLEWFVQESPDPSAVSRLLKKIDLSKTCINVVSKSGNTIETLVLFDFFRSKLQKVVKEKWPEHIVITTEEGDGKLFFFVKQFGCFHFPIPKNVGGRFSVFSNVGLFPLACLGVDIEALLKGAKMGMEHYGDLENNPAYKSASIHHLLNKNDGKSIAVLVSYAEALKEFGGWFAQLWGESLGKEGKGFTPLVARGPQFQHSLAQLFLDGPKDKIATLIHVASLAQGPLGELLERECCATVQALKNSKVPVFVVTLPDLKPETLGELLAFYQTQTVFLSHLMGVDPYNQPAVERIKQNF